MNVNPKKAYAIRVTNTEVEIYREFSTMVEAERLWKNPKFYLNKTNATVSGVFLIDLLKKRKLVTGVTKNAI